MKDRVSIDLKDGVADVRLIRADKMNALDRAMFDGIVEAGVEVAKVTVDKLDRRYPTGGRPIAPVGPRVIVVDGDGEIGGLHVADSLDVATDGVQLDPSPMAARDRPPGQAGTPGERVNNPCSVKQHRQRLPTTPGGACARAGRRHRR